MPMPSTVAIQETGILELQAHYLSGLAGWKESMPVPYLVPEQDKLVAELSKVFVHGEASLLKNAVALLDDSMDHVPARQDHIEGYTGLFGSPDEGFPEKPDTICYTVRVEMPGLGEIPGHPGGLDAEKIIEDFWVFAFPQHVMVMGIGVHLFELGRDNPAGAEDDEVVLFRCQHLRDN
jgi:hypothetical protein